MFIVRPPGSSRDNFVFPLFVFGLLLLYVCVVLFLVDVEVSFFCVQDVVAHRFEMGSR